MGLPQIPGRFRNLASLLWFELPQTVFLIRNGLFPYRIVTSLSRLQEELQEQERLSTTDRG